MDETQFQQMFQRLDAPALLKTGEQWFLNPAAQALELSAGELELLAEHGEDAALWLAHQFYHVSASPTDDGCLFILQPDSFFAAGADRVSGQLRAYLSNAFGAAFSLSRNQALRTDPRARRELAGVSQALYQIFRMVIEFEQCAAPDDPHPRTAAVDLAEWFQRLSGELEELCRSTGVKFTAQTDQTYLPTLANGRQLELAVLSLISNALKNAPAKGGHITLSLKRQKDHAVISVADNMGGFSPEVLTHPIWSQPIRPVPQQGVGLGLPMAQRIIADHEGSLMVFPSDKGTRLVLSLPLREPDGLFSTARQPGWDDVSPGFSPAKIFLSEVLPPELYYPNPDGDEGA